MVGSLHPTAFIAGTVGFPVEIMGRLLRLWEIVWYTLSFLSLRPIKMEVNA